LQYYRDTGLEDLASQSIQKQTMYPVQRKILSLVPDRLFILAGQLLYKHVG